MSRGTEVTPPAPQRGEDRRSLEWVVGLGVFGLAAVLRLHDYAVGLTADEVWFLDTAQRSWHGFWSKVTADWIHPPLAHLLLRSWIALWGAAPAATRLLPVTGGLLAIAALYGLMRHIAGWRVASLAAFLLAVSPLHLAYSQEMRGYPWMTLFTLLSSWTLIRWQEQPDRYSRMISYLAASLLLVQAHYFGWLVIACHGLWVLAGRSGRTFSQHWWMVQGLLIALSTPWFIVALREVHHQGTTGVSAQTMGWLVPPSVPDLEKTLFQFDGWLPFFWARAIKGALWVGLWTWGVIWAVRSRTSRRAALLLLMITTLPLLLVTYLSYEWKPIFATHYFLFVVPLYGAVVAWGAWSLPSRFAGCAVACLVAAGGASSAWFLRHEHHIRFDRVAAYLTETLPPGPGVILTENVYGLNPLSYYYRGPYELHALHESFIRIAPQTSVVPETVAWPIGKVVPALQGRVVAAVTYTKMYRHTLDAGLQHGHYTVEARREFRALDMDDPKTVRVTIYAPAPSAAAPSPAEPQPTSQQKGDTL